MGHGFYGYAKYWENWVQWSIIIGVFSCTVASYFQVKSVIK